MELALSRVPSNMRQNVMDIMNQSKSSLAQKRALLLKKGILRSAVDELEALADVGASIGYSVQLCKCSCHDISCRG